MNSIKQYELHSQKIGNRKDLYRAIMIEYSIKTALYPGSYIDIAPSIVIEDVTYVDSFKGANDLHFLNIITVTRALNAIGGKDTEGLRARIESLQVDPYSAGLTKSKLLNSTNNMVAFLKDNLVKLEDRYDTAPNPSIKDKVKSDIGEIEYLLDQYQLLQTNLMGTQGTAGTGPVDPNNSPSLTRPDG